jgi:hypothetical protein
MTFADNKPLTTAELKRLAELGNRELAAHGVRDRRWIIWEDRLELEKTGS